VGPRVRGEDGGQCDADKLAERQYGA
jgi:hypothetical protein